MPPKSHPAVGSGVSKSQLVAFDIVLRGSKSITRILYPVLFSIA